MLDSYQKESELILGILLWFLCLEYNFRELKKIFAIIGLLLNKDFSKLIIVASDDINEIKLKEFIDKNH